MEVERLTAVLEASGLSGFVSAMRTSDDATAKVKSTISGLSAAQEQASRTTGTLRSATVTYTSAADAQAVAVARAATATEGLAGASIAAGVAHGRHRGELQSLEREARGAVGSFTGLSRTMMFASNAFLAGAIGGGIIKSIVDATRAQGAAQAQLRMSIANTGASWQVYGHQVEQTIKRESDLSQFTKTDLTGGLNRLVLATGDVGKAQTDLHISTNLARAAHEDLGTAVAQVARAETGRLTTIRALGIAVPRVTTVEDELKRKLAEIRANHEQVGTAELQHAQKLAKLRDQTATAAAMMDVIRQKTDGADQSFSRTSEGSLARFDKSLEELQISIGHELLPAMTPLINDLSEWADRMAKSGQAQRDAKEAVESLTGAVRTAKTAIELVDKVTGSFKNTLELLLALKMVSVIASWIESLKKLAAVIGLTSAAGGAGVAGRASGLLGVLNKLKALGPIAIVVTASLIPHSNRGQAALDRVHLGFLGHLPLIGGALTQSAAGGDYLGSLVGGYSALDWQRDHKYDGMTPQQIFNAAHGKRTTFFGPATYTTSPGVNMQGENAMIPQGLNALAHAGYDVNVTSGYRTYAQQAALYARYVKSGYNIRYIAAPPGHSNHETGNAVDVYVNGKPVDAVPGALAILKKYGLVADVKGDHEHLDYVGPNRARNMGGGGGTDFGLHPIPKAGKGKAGQLIPQDLLDAVSMYSNLASNLDNTGKAAKDYLDQELATLTKEYALLEGKLAAAKGKNKAAIEKALTDVENNMRDVGTLIRDAVVITGAALIPAKLRSRLAGTQAQYTADFDYAAVLVGDTASKYAVILRDNLRGQASVLRHEISALKQKLSMAEGKQRTAIQDELVTVKGALTDVQSQILQSLQGSVQSLQSKVSGFLGKVQQELVTQFEAQTQKLADDLGAKFFQNGLQSPLESQLSQMQAEDTFNSLRDSLQAAQEQLANDQNTLAAVVYEASTGITSYIYDQAALKQVSADQKAIAQAQRAIDENDLAIRAAKERADADRNYTEQLTALQATRTSLENEMNSKLSALSDGFENGTGTMASLTQIAATYGLQISNTTVPDFDNLSTASKNLVSALADLARYIADMTGHTPAPAPTDTSTAGSPAIAYVQAAQATAEALGQYVDYFVSGGQAYYQSNSGNYGKKPMLAAGGLVRHRPGGVDVTVGEGAEDELVMPLSRARGGSMTVQLTVQALDPESVDWDTVAGKVRDAFGRMARSGTPDPWSTP